MTKLLLILGLASALAAGLARARPEPPLLIDSSAASPGTSLDANS